MGYRSTFITTDKEILLPHWFLDKWGDWIHYKRTPTSNLPISSVSERSGWYDLIDDIKQVLVEINVPYYDFHIDIIVMGEDGKHTFTAIFYDHHEDWESYKLNHL